MLIGSSSNVPFCGFEAEFADIIGGGENVGGKTGLKGTGESTESSGSVGGRFVLCHVSSSFYPNQAMKPTVKGR